MERQWKGSGSLMSGGKKAVERRRKGGKKIVERRRKGIGKAVERQWDFEERRRVSPPGSRRSSGSSADCVHTGRERAEQMSTHPTGRT